MDNWTAIHADLVAAVHRATEAVPVGLDADQERDEISRLLDVLWADEELTDDRIEHLTDDEKTAKRLRRVWRECYKEAPGTVVEALALLDRLDEKVAHAL